MKLSARLLILGLVLFCVGVVGYYLGAPREVVASSVEDADTTTSVVGLVAGLVSGLGIVLFVVGFVQRMLGR